MIPFRLFFPLLLALACRLQAQDLWVDRSNELVGIHTPGTVVHAGGLFFIFSGRDYAHSASGTASWQAGSFPDASIHFGVSGAATDGARLVVTGNQDSIYTANVADLGASPGWQRHRPFGNESLTINRVRRLNGFFVAGATADMSSTNSAEHVWRALSSSDGLNWTEHRIAPPAGLLPNYSGIVDLARGAPTEGGDAVWVASVTTADTLLILSDDFTTATRVTVPGMGFARSLVFGGGTFVAACDNGKIYRSLNGTIWELCSLPVATNSLRDVFHDGSRFVAVGNPVPDRSNRATILHSVDGTTWEFARELPPTFYGLTTVYHADGLWLAAGTSGRLLSSGASSFPPPTFSLGPEDARAQVGQTVTFSATLANGEGATLQWLHNGAPLAENIAASGTETATLTLIAGLHHVGEYTLQASNPAGTTRSRAARLSVSLGAGGATLHTYATSGIQGSMIIAGSVPPSVILDTGYGEQMPLAIFTPATGLVNLPNTRTAAVNYTIMGGVAPAGNRIVLGDSYGAAPPLIYDLGTQQDTTLPSPTTLLPGKKITAIRPTGLSNNGDVIGVIKILYESDRAFVFSAATGAYSLLSDLPNASNYVARLASGISADGRRILGFGSEASVPSVFLWSLESGFSLLPNTSNGSKSIIQATAFSPNGRYLIGYSDDGFPLRGNSAVRWDGGAAPGVPGEFVGFGLPRRSTDTAGIALTVTDDGTVGGRLSGAYDSPAGVWLPSGAFVSLRDHVLAAYGINLADIGVSSVTSISSDRRVLAGTSIIGGWLLTLPTPLELTTPTPDINVRAVDVALGSTTFAPLGSRKINDGYNSQTLVVQNLGSGPLTTLSLSLSGPDKDDFSIVYAGGAASFPGALGINEHTTIEIRFAPRSLLTTSRSATLTVENNDPDEPAYTITLIGTATLSASHNTYLWSLNTRGVPAHQQGFTDDPDGDGLPNLLEFALGLQPDIPSASSPFLPRLQIADGTLSLAYRRAMTPHVDYVVEASTELGTWTTAGVNQGVPDFAGFTTASVSLDGGPRQFLRLKVTLKP